MDLCDIKSEFPFGSPDEDVILAENEPMEITLDSEGFRGDGKAILSLGRTPQIRVTVPLNVGAMLQIHAQGGTANEKVRLSMPARDITIEQGFICYVGGSLMHGSSGTHKQPAISWTSTREPFYVLGNETTEIDSIVFHFLNCPELPGNPDSDVSDRGSFMIRTVNLKWDGWIIEFKSIPELSKTLEQVRNSGGFGLTHIGQIRKEDNAKFNMSEAENIRDGFSSFMSFVVGRRCCPCCCVGYADQKRVCEDWSTNFSAWYAPMTWATGRVHMMTPTDTIEKLFPLFMDLYQPNASREALSETISWYRSTTEPGRPQIDQIIILLQAGIERLAYEYSVNRKKLIHKTGFKDLRASDRFRLLFSSLGIPLDIPPELKDMTALAEEHKWEDIPHGLTEIRNAMVHPEHKKKGRLDGVYYDAWRVALEWLELSILGFCGYAGQYYSRSKEKNIEVPWA